MSDYTATVARLARFALAVLLFWGAFYNIWGFIHETGGAPAPGVVDEIVLRNNQFETIRGALILENYRIGPIGYVTRRSLKGEPRTSIDDLHWVEFRFAAIPLMLVLDVPDPLYLLGDFMGEGSVPSPPEGFTVIADPGNGLILYKKTPRP